MAIPNWLTLSTESGNSGTTVVLLTADTNTTYNQRSYIFTVSTNNTGKQKQVQIIQNASGADDYSIDYLTLEIISGGTIKVNAVRGMYYSKNGGEWLSASTGTSISVQAGDELEWKNDYYYNPSFSSASTATFNVYGNAMSLIYGDNFAGKTDMVKSLETLFKNTKVIDASDLVLPATTLASHCYDSMFEGCSGLTTAPSLPAIILTEWCYFNMFKNCSSLTTAPSLPATTLASHCYDSMFEGCGNLITAPSIISSTNIPDFACSEMFHNCTSLTTAPALPATTLGESCYAYMFQNCTSLTNMPELPATTLTDMCYLQMFGNCTSLTTTKPLNATVVAYACYYGMFWDCTGLTTAPSILPATTLAEACYQSMFQNCNNLNNTPALPATTLAKSCYSNMFVNCSSLTTAPLLPATILEENCYEYMFDGCTALFNIPSILPATTLTKQCYYYMFYNCPNITEAPTLPATTVVTSAYTYMFSECGKLNFIKCLATNISSYGCTSNWVKNVSGSGIFVKEASMNNWEIDNVNGIPIGWTLYNNNEIVTNKEAIVFYGNSSNDTIKILSTPTGTWTASTTDNWIVLNNTTGNERESVSISCGSNVNGTERIGEITITDGIITKTITVVQSEVDYEYYSQQELTLQITQSGNLYPEGMNIKYKINNNDWQRINSYYGVNINVESGDTVIFKNVESNVYSLTFKSGNPNPNTAGFIVYGSIDKFGEANGAMRQVSFGNCTGLTSARNLILGNGVSCAWMFGNCESLTEIPVITATTLTDGCYGNMFRGCISLVNAPKVLPATTLADDCYANMFSGCTSLTTAPDLPAKNITDYCYEYMFDGCTNLNYIKCLATTLDTDSTRFWLNGVASSGTFVKASGVTWESGNNGIPNGWTVQEI